LRVYTAEPWEFTIDDVNLVQAVAQIGGMALDMDRLSRGYKSSIEILKSMRDPKQLKSTKRTPYEGGSCKRSPETVTQFKLKALVSVSGQVLLSNKNLASPNEGMDAIGVLYGFQF
jgi:hypothetical protein